MARKLSVETFPLVVRAAQTSFGARLGVGDVEPTSFDCNLVWHHCLNEGGIVARTPL